MNNECKVAAGNLHRLAFIILSSLCISGCASLPPVLHYTSMALSGISYISTGKGPSDHAISIVTHKDCTLLRALALKPICIEVHEYTNKPVWVRLLDRKTDEFPDDMPMPPEITLPARTEVVQLD